MWLPCTVDAPGPGNAAHQLTPVSTSNGGVAPGRAHLDRDEDDKCDAGTTTAKAPSPSNAAPSRVYLLI